MQTRHVSSVVAMAISWMCGVAHGEVCLRLLPEKQNATHGRLAGVRLKLDLASKTMTILGKGGEGGPEGAGPRPQAERKCELTGSRKNLLALFSVLEQSKGLVQITCAGTGDGQVVKGRVDDVVLQASWERCR